MGARRSESREPARPLGDVGRQQFLQKTQGLETLHRELVNAIASLVARDNDEELRKILTDHGIGASAAPRPPGRP